MKVARSTNGEAYPSAAGVDTQTPFAASAMDETKPDATAADLLEQGRNMISKNRISEAIALLSHATYIAPDMAEAHHLLAWSYDRKGLHQLSESSFKRAVSLAPGDPIILNDYGYSLFLTGHNRAAKDFLKKAAKLAK